MNSGRVLAGTIFLLVAAAAGAGAFGLSRSGTTPSSTVPDAVAVGRSASSAAAAAAVIPSNTARPQASPRKTPPATPAAARSKAPTPASTSSPALTPTPTKRSSTAAASAARTTAPVSTVSSLPIQGTIGDARQLVTVASPYGTSTRATLQAWTRSGAGWVKTGSAVPAWLGDGGLTTHPSEAFDGTPIGSFTLTQAFGNNANPGAKLPYFRSGPDDWWSSDSSSPTYNTHQHCAAQQCTFDTSVSENLYAVGWVYGYAVVINYNTSPAVPGKGSAFFLHVSANGPTAGCVSIPEPDLVRILRWLDPAQHPRILIGIS